MTRPIVKQYADEAGVPEDILTTMSDLFSGEYGLPDTTPYNETVVLKAEIKSDSPDAVKWQDYVFRKYLEGHDRESDHPMLNGHIPSASRGEK